MWGDRLQDALPLVGLLVLRLFALWLGRHRVIPRANKAVSEVVQSPVNRGKPDSAYKGSKDEAELLLRIKRISAWRGDLIALPMTVAAPLLLLIGRAPGEIVAGFAVAAVGVVIFSIFIALEEPPEYSSRVPLLTPVAWMTLVIQAAGVVAAVATDGGGT